MAAAAATSLPAFAADPLKLWTIGIAKVGAKDWSAMSAQAGIEIAYSAKSARADEAIQKMVVGDGNKLYDAMSDNGGGMEDALASQKTIVPLDVSKIPNWKNLLPVYREGGAAADTIRYEGKVYAVPYISNADSLAYNYSVIGADLDSLGSHVRRPVQGPRSNAERLRSDSDEYGDLSQTVRQAGYRQSVGHECRRGQGCVSVPHRAKEEGTVQNFLGTASRTV